MPEGDAGAALTSSALSGRHNRPALVAFVTDAPAEEALRDGFSGIEAFSPDIRRGGKRERSDAVRRRLHAFVRLRICFTMPDLTRSPSRSPDVTARW